MPEISIAPSAPPVASAVVANLAATSATPGKAPSATSGDPAATFAAILQRQLGGIVDAKTTALENTLTAELAAQSLAIAGTDNLAMTLGKEPGAGEASDALTLMAMMLAGKIPLQADGGSATKPAALSDSKDEEASVPTAEMLAAAAMSGLVPQAPASGPKETPGSRGDLSATTGTRPTATLAAGDATNAAAVEGLAEKAGKTENLPTNFDTLLASAHDASEAGAQNTGVASQQHNLAAQDASLRSGAPVVTSVTTPVGAQGWDREIGDKISWMANRQDSRAELVLNPPHLGRIEVTLTMNGDQASASFTSANPLVRDALEMALPRLREILQEAGITLGQANVGAESFQQSAGRHENGDNPARGGVPQDSEPLIGELAPGGNVSGPWQKLGNGLVDTFA